MPAPLSLDLRQRIVTAYERGEGSQAEMARRFDVSQSSVLRLLKRYRITGSVAPKAQRHGRSPQIEEHHQGLFEQWLGEDPSLSQAELAQRFTETTGRPTSQQSLSRALARFRVTRKKRP